MPMGIISRHSESESETANGWPELHGIKGLSAHICRNTNSLTLFRSLFSILIFSYPQSPGEMLSVGYSEGTPNNHGITTYLIQYKARMIQLPC